MTKNDRRYGPIVIRTQPTDQREQLARVWLAEYMLGNYTNGALIMRAGASDADEALRKLAVWGNIVL